MNQKFLHEIGKKTKRIKFKFIPNLEHQNKAIKSIKRLFNEIKEINQETIFLKKGASSFPLYGNNNSYNPNRLLETLIEIQKENNLPLDDKLDLINNKIQIMGEIIDISFPNFSIEMETGTGKTYVYLRSIMEIFSTKKIKKFIIIVPSIAIREGVAKTLNLLKFHFNKLYSNIPYSFYVYDSKNMSQLNSYVKSTTLNILIMTLASFNKDINLINQPNEKIQGFKPITLLQFLNPILILDEPQNFESKKSIDSISSLNPLLVLRFSATHRNPYNIIYRLSPLEAYNKRLVKRIEVTSILKRGGEINPYLACISIHSQKNEITGRLKIDYLNSHGVLSKRDIVVAKGDKLSKFTNLSIYDDYEVEIIDRKQYIIKFLNGVVIHEREEFEVDKIDIFREQIKFTILAHFDKQERLLNLGIKVISLFFIDKVSNYSGNNPIIKNLFDNLFNGLKSNYKFWEGKTSEEVQGAYFAKSRTRKGSIKLNDSTTGESKRDLEVYNLIFRDKDKLLSLNEPISFIFSHSALREGWDNPNVFQICTLNNSITEIRKRQEIGRGIRLAVNMKGERVTDEKLNILTVIANENYKNYVSSLQKEITDDYKIELESKLGKKFKNMSKEERLQIEKDYGIQYQQIVHDANKKVIISLNQNIYSSESFKGFWSILKYKSVYLINFDSDIIIQETIKNFAKIPFTETQITIEKAVVHINQRKEFSSILMNSSSQKLSKIFENEPNFYQILNDYIESYNLPIKLTKVTMVKILNSIQNIEFYLSNIHQFSKNLAKAISNSYLKSIKEISYRKTGKIFEKNNLAESYYLWPNLVSESKKSLYNKIPHKSIKDQKFCQEMNDCKSIVSFFKFSDWYTIPTPVGDYIPKWGVIWKNQKSVIYLVIDNLSPREIDNLTKKNKLKIENARRYFEDREIHFELAYSIMDLNQDIFHYKDCS